MRNTCIYKSVKNFSWLLVPAILGFYQSKLNVIQSTLESVNYNNVNELISTIIPNIVILRIIGYITFLILIVIYFKAVKSK